MATRNCAPPVSDQARFNRLDNGHKEPRGSSPGSPVDERLLVRLLRLERRRTERSGRPFLLVLISSSSKELALHALIGELAPALTSCLRETDILGWYQQDKVLALLMTELGELSPNSVDIIMRRVSDVLTAITGPDLAPHLVIDCRIFPQAADPDLRGRDDEVFYPDLSDRHDPSKRSRLLKRGMDILGSLIALIAFSPAFALIALLVRLTSKGPVFFAQKRVGQFNREFTFFKFRTMYANNDPSIHREYVARLINGNRDAQQSNGTYKLVDDPRITPVGRFLRKTSLDELPQFLNVLLNDMSLVGPRPPLPYECSVYRAWHRRRVLEIKPGITGLWQITGRSRTTFDEMVRMDLQYSRNRSLWMDLMIVLRTPAAMFSGRGAC